MKGTIALLLVAAIVVSSALASKQLFPRLGTESTDRQQRDASIKNICGRQVPTHNELGHGAFGAAYLVPIDQTQNSASGMAVLKVPNRAGKGALLQEIYNYLKAGVHQNVAKVIGVCKDPEAPLIMLEYIEGMTLANWRTQNYPYKAVPVEIQYTILSQLGDALYWIERRKLMHSDGHHKNILLVESGQKLLLKLIDFGVGRDLASVAGSNAFYIRDVRAFCSVAWQLARAEQGSLWVWWFESNVEERVLQLSRKYQDNKAEGVSNPKWVSQILRMCISALPEQNKTKSTSMRRFVKFLGGLAPRPKDLKT